MTDHVIGLSDNEYYNLGDWDERLSPHGQALGIEYVKVEDGCLFVKVPYAEHLVGNPDTGVIHGGVITAAMDNASGWSTRLSNEFVEGQTLATLDLRIDYMKPATPDEDLLDPVATSVASFMLRTPSERKPA